MSGLDWNIMSIFECQYCGIWILIRSFLGRSELLAILGWRVVRLVADYTNTVQYQYTRSFKGMVSREEYFFGRLIIINRYTVHALIVFTSLSYLFDEKIKLKILASSLKILPVTRFKTLKRRFLHWICIREAACDSVKPYTRSRLWQVNSCTLSL
jgi:hypothetical protein